MKILVGIPTCKANEGYFWKALSSLNRARAYMKENMDVEVNLLMFDFSDPQKDQIATLPSWATRLCLSGYGFTDNFNVARNVALTHNYDYLCFLNDDVIIHKKFLDNGIFILENNPDIGFLGGHSQQGGWNEKYENTIPPEPILEIVDLSSLARLNWEFSACIVRAEALRETGPMDRMFSPKIGLCSDNDFLYRMRRVGWRTVRSYFSTFWHSKARSQSKLRNPMDPHDPHRLRAVRYMFLKWGVDIRDEGNKRIAFTEPFNGLPMEIIDEDRILLDNRDLINLEGC
jgi:hypothetical protein